MLDGKTRTDQQEVINNKAAASSPGDAAALKPEAKLYQAME